MPLVSPILLLKKPTVQIQLAPTVNEKVLIFGRAYSTKSILVPTVKYSLEKLPKMAMFNFSEFQETKERCYP